METISAAVTAGVTRQKLTFAYDYLGRRISKIVQSGWTGSAYANTDLSRRFVYNGWNVMAELDYLSSLAVVSNHFWGLDIAGPGQTAGGVGALLMTQEGSNSYLPIYDGNGNVHGMITAGSVTLGGTAYSAGDLVAAYEYDAYGNTLRESGGFAASNPFQYSTKFTDMETSLVYYGTRFYSPSQGRFINRDSIEEQGGLNLYAFCGNNAVNCWDNLGMIMSITQAFSVQPYGEGGQQMWAVAGTMGMPSGAPVVNVGSDFDLTAGGGMSINSALNAAAMVRNGASQADAERVAKAYANGGTEAAENTAQQIDAAHAAANAGGGGYAVTMGAFLSHDTGEAVGTTSKTVTVDQNGSVSVTSYGNASVVDGSATHSGGGGGTWVAPDHTGIPNANDAFFGNINRFIATAGGQRTTNIINSAGDAALASQRGVVGFTNSLTGGLTGTGGVNPNDPAFVTGQQVGSATNGALIVAGTTAGLARAGPAIGDALFARGTGLLNSNNYIRIGWGWKGSATAGSQIFRIAIGNPNSWIHWHFP